MPRSKDQDWLHDIKVGKELKYPKEIIVALKNEPDPNKRDQILRNARHKMMRKN